MIPASKFFGYVHPSTKTPLASAVFVAVAAIAVLLYVNLGGSDPFIAIARVTAWATAGTYIAYQMVVLGGLIARGRGWPKDRAYFNLGKWGWPVNIIALVYGVFMIINLVWPRTPDAAWYDNYLVVVSLVVVVIVGAIIYVIQKARGVDLSATIHEIDESPAEAGAMAAMPAGEAGTVVPGAVSEMSTERPPEGGVAADLRRADDARGSSDELSGAGGAGGRKGRPPRPRFEMGTLGVERDHEREETMANDDDGRPVQGLRPRAAVWRLRYTRRRVLILGGALVAGAAAVVAGIRAFGGTAATKVTDTISDQFGPFPVRSVEDVPVVPADAVGIKVDGLVETPLTVDHAAWTGLQRLTETVDFHCVEGWSVDDVRWGGVAPAVLLDQAGVRPEARYAVFHAYGGTYLSTVPLDLVRDAQTVLADSLNGDPLPAKHGGPLRLVVPDQLGYKSVKWVERIELTDSIRAGYWEERGYPEDAPIPGG